MNRALFDDGPYQPYEPRGRGVGYAETPQQQFERFHHRHPEVYDELRDLCLQWIADEREMGVTKPQWSIWGAYQVLRWQRHRGRRPDIQISNNHTTFYARLLMSQEPELAGLFTVHESKHAEDFKP